jgi:hypothetical protein
MGKKKATIGLAPGTRIRVKPGVMSPDFPEVSFAGWTGSVVEASGKPPSLQYIVEWDGGTLSGMPADYLQRCESQQLYHLMACLPEGDVEPVD